MKRNCLYYILCIYFVDKKGIRWVWKNELCVAKRNRAKNENRDY